MDYLRLRVLAPWLVMSQIAFDMAQTVPPSGESSRHEHD
jgi:hypothetical protein